MKSRILGLLAVGLMVASLPAQATVIIVGGNAYDITTVTGAYVDNQSLLESQIWWDNSDLAKTFAETLPSDVGLLNPGPTGPIFAFAKYLTGANYTFASWARRSNDEVLLAQGPVGQGGLVFAIARRVANPVPEPGTLALLGLGLAGLGLSRRRKAA